MKRILYLLFFVIALAAIGLVHFQYPGSVTLVWLGYQIQFSVMIGLLALLFILCTALFLIHIFLWFIGLPLRWSSSITHLQTSKAKQDLLALFTAYEAEAISTALQHQKKAAKYLGESPFFLWISGHVFEKANDILEAEKCFLDLTKNPATAFLGLKGKTRMALHKGDVASAYDFLKRAEKHIPHSPWVLKTLLALAREKNNFKEAQDFILRLEDLEVFSKEQSKKQMAYILYQEAIYPETSPEDKESLLRQSHYLDPSLHSATEIFAPLLQKQGHKKYALSVIEATWKLDPSQRLGDLYIEISAPSKDLEAYEVAKTLVEEAPKNPESLLFLARRAFQAQLWGEARMHLKMLMETTKNPTTSVYELLAKLEMVEHKDWKTAMKWLEEGLKAPRHA